MRAWTAGLASSSAARAGQGSETPSGARGPGTAAVLASREEVQSRAADVPENAKAPRLKKVSSQMHSSSTGGQSKRHISKDRPLTSARNALSVGVKQSAAAAVAARHAASKGRSNADDKKGSKSTQKRHWHRLGEEKAAARARRARASSPQLEHDEAETTCSDESYTDEDSMSPEAAKKVGCQKKLAASSDESYEEDDEDEEEEEEEVDDKNDEFDVKHKKGEVQKKTDKKLVVKGSKSGSLVTPPKAASSKKSAHSSAVKTGKISESLGSDLHEKSFEQSQDGTGQSAELNKSKTQPTQGPLQSEEKRSIRKRAPPKLADGKDSRENSSKQPKEHPEENAIPQEHPIDAKQLTEAAVKEDTVDGGAQAKKPAKLAKDRAPHSKNSSTRGQSEHAAGKKSKKKDASVAAAPNLEHGQAQSSGLLPKQQLPTDNIVAEILEVREQTHGVGTSGDGGDDEREGRSSRKKERNKKKDHAVKDKGTTSHQDQEPLDIARTKQMKLHSNVVDAVEQPDPWDGSKRREEAAAESDTHERKPQQDEKSKRAGKEEIVTSLDPSNPICSGALDKREKKRKSEGKDMPYAAPKRTSKDKSKEVRADLSAPEESSAPNNDTIDHSTENPGVHGAGSDAAPSNVNESSVKLSISKKRIENDVKDHGKKSKKHKKHIEEDEGARIAQLRSPSLEPPTMASHDTAKGKTPKKDKKKNDKHTADERCNEQDATRETFSGNAVAAPEAMARNLSHSKEKKKKKERYKEDKVKKRSCDLLRHSEESRDGGKQPKKVDEGVQKDKVADTELHSPQDDVKKLKSTSSTIRDAVQKHRERGDHDKDRNGDRDRKSGKDKDHKSNYSQCAEVSKKDKRRRSASHDTKKREKNHRHERRRSGSGRERDRTKREAVHTHRHRSASGKFKRMRFASSNAQHSQVRLVERAAVAMPTRNLPKEEAEAEEENGGMRAAWSNSRSCSPVKVDERKTAEELADEEVLRRRKSVQEAKKKAEEEWRKREEQEKQEELIQKALEEQREREQREYEEEKARVEALRLAKIAELKRQGDLRRKAKQEERQRAQEIAARKENKSLQKESSGDHPSVENKDTSAETAPSNVEKQAEETTQEKCQSESKRDNAAGHHDGQQIEREKKKEEGERSRRSRSNCRHRSCNRQRSRSRQRHRDRDFRRRRTRSRSNRRGGRRSRSRNSRRRRTRSRSNRHRRTRSRSIRRYRSRSGGRRRSRSNSRKRPRDQTSDGTDGMTRQSTNVANAQGSANNSMNQDAERPTDVQREAAVEGYKCEAECANDDEQAIKAAEARRAARLAAAAVAPTQTSGEWSNQAVADFAGMHPQFPTSPEGHLNYPQQHFAGTAFPDPSFYTMPVAGISPSSLMMWQGQVAFNQAQSAAAASWMASTHADHIYDSYPGGLQRLLEQRDAEDLARRASQDSSTAAEPSAPAVAECTGHDAANAATAGVALLKMGANSAEAAAIATARAAADPAAALAAAATETAAVATAAAAATAGQISSQVMPANFTSCSVGVDNDQEQSGCQQVPSSHESNVEGKAETCIHTQEVETALKTCTEFAPGLEGDQSLQSREKESSSIPIRGVTEEVGTPAIQEIDEDRAVLIAKPSRQAAIRMTCMQDEEGQSDGSASP